MMEALDRQKSLTGNQIKIIAAAMLGDMMEFFDYFLIGFVLAFVIKPWNLTYLQVAILLLSSGFGAMFGAAFWGWMADKVGRRIVFNATILNFSVATGLLYFTPDNGWEYMTAMRFFVGFGVGGLYCVDLPLVQEFMPARRRGMVGGLVTACIPVGTMIAGLLAANLTGAGAGNWRILFLIGVLPALLVLLVRMWVPESPRWLMQQGRNEDARQSVAWALQVPATSLPLPNQTELTAPRIGWTELFRYPRSMIVSFLGNLGAQTGVYGLTLWAPTLMVLVLKVPAAEAAGIFAWVAAGGFIGRVFFSFFSDMLGRRVAGGLLGFGAACMLILAAVMHTQTIAGYPAFPILLFLAYFFADGGFAIVGPYAAEVWPAHLRTTGMGAAYGFGGLGKVIGPLGLALIVGSSDIVKPGADVAHLVPAFTYLAAWFALAGAVYLFFGLETKGRSIESIDRQLANRTSV